MSFNDRFHKICQTKNSHVCVGLDVDINKIPPFLRHTDDPLFEFSKAIIEATVEFVAAFKINTAFFEAHGHSGWLILEKIVNYLPTSVIKIADAKRADIGNTSRMYARAFFDKLSFDAITVNPYLGSDAIAPFIENKEKGAFVLCITSNKGAVDFQHAKDDTQFLYERVAIKVKDWNNNDNCGLVVGATYPYQLKQVRNLAPGLPFLIPGIGVQGGDLALAVKFGLAKPSDDAIFNSSREIIYSSNDKNFAETAAQKTLELRDEINRLKMLVHNSGENCDERRGG